MTHDERQQNTAHGHTMKAPRSDALNGMASSTDYFEIWREIMAPLPKISMRRDNEEVLERDAGVVDTEATTRQNDAPDTVARSRKRKANSSLGDSEASTASVPAQVSSVHLDSTKKLGKRRRLEKQAEENTTLVMHPPTQQAMQPDQQHLVNHPVQPQPHAQEPKKTRQSKAKSKPKRNKAQRNNSSTTNNPEDRKKRTPCVFFMKGHCHKGVNCEFRHDGVAVNKFHTIPCQFFLQGICRKGDDCGYSHDLSQCPCKFFHMYGKCSKGASCVWRHGTITPEELQSLREQHHAEEIKREQVEKETVQQEEKKKSLFEEMLASQTNMFGGL